MFRPSSTALFAALALAAGSGEAWGDGVKDAVSPLDLFEERIMPIFKSENPSSCVQCHLASVDLKDYILPSHEDTFASLRSQGLVDIDKPEKSKILELIQMGEKDYDKGAKLIHEKTRKAEYEAFAAWIKACSKDPVLSKLPAPKELGKPKVEDAVIRHARKSRVVDSFVRNVWSQRMRCFPCHTPFEIDENNPKHRKPRQRLEEFELEWGKKHAERLRIFKKTPEETLQFLIERSQKPRKKELPMINLEDPRKSLIVLKPTSRLPKKTDDGFERPSSLEPTSHMGGLKMHVDDHSYKSFIAWLEDYAKVVGGEYKSVEELPADNWYPSKQMVMVTHTPAEWKPLTRVQLLVHAWDEKSKAWRPDPVAFTQNSVSRKHSVFGVLFLVRSDESDSVIWEPEEATLEPGKYLIKAYVDSHGRLKDDPTAFLGKEDFYAEAEIDAKWRKLFPNREKIPGDLFRK